MTEAIFDLPSHLRRRLVAALECGSLSAPFSSLALRNTLEEESAAESTAAALNSLVQMGLTAAGCAEWIRSVEKVVGRSLRPDLVWSGPEIVGVHARDTRQVFEELISSAQRNICACSYAYFDGQKAFEKLAARMDAVPDLSVTLFLNIERRKGDTTIPDDLVRRFADRLWEKDWPGKRRPRVYYDPRSLEPARPAGVLHAKAVVADDESVFITSANMTEAALDRNIELGLLVRDRTLAATLVAHLRALVDMKLVSVLPEA